MMSRMFPLPKFSGPLLVAALALALSGLSLPARAADEPAEKDTPPAATTMFSSAYVKEVWGRDKLGGDWMGIRKILTDNGIDADFRMTQWYQGSTSGGVRDHAQYGGNFASKFMIDMNKLIGTWEGLYVSVHVDTRWGKDIDADVGAFSLVNTPALYPLPGDYGGSQVTGLMLVQNFGQFDVLAGKLNVIDVYTTIYPEVTFGQEGFMNVNSLASAWPWFRFINLSIYGAAGWWTDEKGRILYGAFAFGQDNVTTTWKMNDSFDDGVGFLGFARHFWQLGDNDLEGSIAGFVGGATKSYPALDDTDWSVLLSTGNTVFLVPGLGDREDEPWGFAVYVTQELWKGSKEGQSVSLRTGVTPYAREGPSFANWNAFVSVEGNGVVPGRLGDRMGAAFSYNNLSPDLQDLASTVGIGLRDPWNLEFYYNIELNAWLHVTANFQLVENGRRDDDLAVIPGVRTVIDF
jgi:porin